MTAIVSIGYALLAWWLLAGLFWWIKMTMDFVGGKWLGLNLWYYDLKDKLSLFRSSK